MKTIRVKVYKYDELNEEAKEKAVNWMMKDQGDAGQWAWENTKDDAENVGLILKGQHRGSMTGDFKTCATDCAKLIVENHGQTCETFKDAMNFIHAVAIEWNVNFDEEADELNFQGEANIENLENEFLETVLEDYRILSDQDQEYAYSKENMEEDIRCNEYTFTKDGKRFG